MKIIDRYDERTCPRDTQECVAESAGNSGVRLPAPRNRGPVAFIPGIRGNCTGVVGYVNGQRGIGEELVEYCGIDLLLVRCGRRTQRQSARTSGVVEKFALQRRLSAADSTTDENQAPGSCHAGFEALL
ncbi:hypothetical protein GCM10010253_63260 [Streptomyces badius]|uniref:Uncharacterized protein n=1 Tax=Streptomyces badius TaxID=1941 RepID=A0ABQ2TRB6_STRBA|nr:hypothetical protein GCM10010253_63260 [Streptomyces badius]